MKTTLLAFVLAFTSLSSHTFAESKTCACKSCELKCGKECNCQKEDCCKK